MLTSEFSAYFSYKEYDSNVEFYWKSLLANVLMNHIEYFVGRVRSENDLKKIREIKKKGLENYHACEEIVLKSSGRKRLSSLELKIEKMMERYYVRILKEQFGPESKFDISECVDLLSRKRIQTLYTNFFSGIVKNDRHKDFMTSLNSILLKKRFGWYELDMLKKLIKSDQFEIIISLNSDIITEILHDGIEMQPTFGAILPDIIKLLKINLSIVQVAKLFTHLIGSDILESISIGNNMETISEAFDIVLQRCKKQQSLKEAQAFKNLVILHNPSLEVWNYIKDERNRHVNNNDLIRSTVSIQFLETLFDMFEIEISNLRDFRLSKCCFFLFAFLRQKSFIFDRNDLLSLLFTPPDSYHFREYLQLYQFCKIEYNFSIYEEFESTNLVCSFFKSWRMISAEMFFEAILPNELILVENISDTRLLKDCVTVYLDRIYYAQNPKQIIDYLQNKFNTSIFDMDFLESMIYRKKYTLDSMLHSEYLHDFILPIIKLDEISFQPLAQRLISESEFQDSIYSKYPKQSDEYIMALYNACVSIKQFKR